MEKNGVIKEGLVEELLYDKLCSHSEIIKANLLDCKKITDSLKKENNVPDNVSKYYLDSAKRKLKESFSDFILFISNTIYIDIPESYTFLKDNLFYKEEEFFEKFDMVDNFYKLFNHCLDKYLKDGNKDYIEAIKEQIGEEFVCDKKVFEKISESKKIGADLEFLIPNNLYKKLSKQLRGNK